MEDFNRIGLNIWGIRGGYRSFCHTENIDVETPEIKNTWKDIREFVYVTDLTVRFYALEFTPNYKVFTIYRPENDTSRTGAYVATTIYVPHDLKINRILDVMRQISDAYHKDHYDAFGNPNTNPDYIQSYAQLLKNYAGNVVREGDMRSWDSSTQDNTPRIMPFTNIAVVEDFFDKPYRKEFLKHQEVMFWDVDCLQNQQSHGVKFQKMESLSTIFETDGKNIAPQFEGGSIKNKPTEGTIAQFMREGVDVTQDWQSSFFYDKTHIAITLKKPFHQPLTYQGPMIGVGSPFVKRGDDYDFSPRLDFNPRQYELPVNVVNVGEKPFDLYFGNQRVGISGGRGMFKFDGSQANGPCKVTLRPDGIKDIKVTDFPISRFFVSGGDELDSLQSCIIESLKLVRFQFNQECTGKLKLRWSDVAMGFNTYNKTYEVVMPAQNNASDFEIVVDGYIAELKTSDANNTTFDVTLTKQSLVVDIVVPDVLRGYLYSDSIILKAGGKSYKGTHVTIPFSERDSQWSLCLAVDNRGNTLACEYDRKPNGEDVVLYPKLAVLANRTNDTLQMMTSPIFEVHCNSTVLVPAGYEVKLKDSEKYNLDVVTDYAGIRTSTVTLKAGFASSSSASTTSSTTGGYQGGYQGGSSSGGAKDNKKYYGIYWFEDKEYKLFENAVTKIFADGSLATMIDGRECILYFDKDRRPVADKQKKHDAANKKNSFKVTVANGRCTVESTLPKPKAGRGGSDNKGDGGDDGSKKKRWLLFGGIFGAVLLLGGLTWLAIILFGGDRGSVVQEPEYTIRIEMSDGTKIDKVYAYADGDKCEIDEQESIIKLFEGWDNVNIRIKTKYEGECYPICVNSQLSVMSSDSSFYVVHKDDGNMMIITATSPAKARFNDIKSKNNEDDCEAIQKYAEIAKDYYEANNLVVDCIFEAEGLVNEKNSESITCFINAFQNVGRAEKDINEFKNKLLDIERMAEQEGERKKNLDEFEKRFKVVRSKLCSPQSIEDLEDSYEKVKDDEKIYEIVNKAIGQQNARWNDTKFKRFWSNFISFHKEFMSLFDGSPNYGNARKVIMDDCDTKHNDGLKKQDWSFNADQRKLMEKLVENEDTYLGIMAKKNTQKNKQYYLLIE